MQTMLLVNTGEGKGKTTAAVGQAVRALGSGLRVAFGQFMKRPDQAGEQAVLETMLGNDFIVLGAGFLRKEEDRPKHRAKALALLEWAEERLTTPPPEKGALLVLDETLYALGAGILEQNEVEALIRLARAGGWHLLLTGRGLPDWLAAQADLVTEMRLVKHPFDAGVKAQKGIEF